MATAAQASQVMPKGAVEDEPNAPKAIALAAPAATQDALLLALATSYSGELS